MLNFCTNNTIDINYTLRVLHYASMFLCLNTSIMLKVMPAYFLKA